MVSLLDPDDRYFGGRVIAAGGAVDGPDGPSAIHNKRLMAGRDPVPGLCQLHRRDSSRGSVHTLSMSQEDQIQ